MIISFQNNGNKFEMTLCLSPFILPALISLLKSYNV